MLERPGLAPPGARRAPGVGASVVGQAPARAASLVLVPVPVVGACVLVGGVLVLARVRLLARVLARVRAFDRDSAAALDEWPPLPYLSHFPSV
eukprot:4610418-Pyramimonas_sp.AAC.1